MHFPPASRLQSVAARLVRPLRRRVQVRPTGRHFHSHTLSEARVRLRGRTLKILVRDGTTDLDLVRMILCHDSEYQLPPQIFPRVIFDIGANIGVTAIYYSAMYPEAEIYCFEPLPENIELLMENADRNGARVRVFPFGLADRTGHFDYHLSDDPRSFGGGTFHTPGGDPQRVLQLPLRSVTEALAEVGVRQVDVFKIDTEGCEWSILQAIPENVRRKAQAFIGELHGIDDWAFCQAVSASHALGLQKRYDRRCFNFLAVRHDLIPRLGAAAPTSIHLAKAA